MKRFALPLLGTVVMSLGLIAGASLAEQEEVPSTLPQPVAVRYAPKSLSAQDQNVLIGRYCFRCHNNNNLVGGLSLETFDAGRAYEQAEIAEKIIRKLQTGMMPPSQAQRPDPETYATLISGLSANIDHESAALAPNTGGRTFQRLNRYEYERSIQELLGLHIDAGQFFPPDTMSAGFDNIADVQGLSTMVMEGYLSAASEISLLAIGDPGAGTREATYEIPRYVSQRERVDGAPYGTRGGISVVHTFPANGEYVFTMAFYDSPIAFLYGKTTYHDEQIEVSINGERVALLDIDRYMDADNEHIKTGPIAVRSGPQQVSASFIQKIDGPVPDLLSPHDWSLADKDIGAAYGVTTLPHLRDLAIAGPYNASGVAATKTRDKIFSCRPTSAAEGATCASDIISRMGAEAYRRPLVERDLQGLMEFYENGAANGGFEAGIRSALEAILASPHFVFRFEPPAALGADRIADLALASRLSFFLWGAPPDSELVTLAEEGRLSDARTLAEQVTRMLDDPRSEALGTRFASQWLRLQDLDKAHPDALTFPDFDQQLSDAMRRETELLFDDLVRRNSSVLKLLTADYTFLNERLAGHYGISGVTGKEFRRTALTGKQRRGLLGHGSILTMTSHASRTSPVLRGKWVMQVLLGSPPPPPPPNVPELDATADADDGRLLTVRERLEMHRANPACNSCHRMIDPIGLALENFGVTGAWRIKDNGVPIDSNSEFYDGQALANAVDLREALLVYTDAFVTTFAENLMAYALGRRVEYTDMPAIRAIVRDARNNSYRVRSFVSGVVISPAFQNNDQVQRTESAGVRDLRH